MPPAVRLHAGEEDGDGNGDVSLRQRLRRELGQRLRHPVSGEPDPLHPRRSPAEPTHAVRGLPAAPAVRRYVQPPAEAEPKNINTQVRVAPLSVW